MEADEHMDGLASGTGPLFADPDPDAARAFFRKKERALANKLISITPVNLDLTAYRMIDQLKRWKLEEWVL